MRAKGLLQPEREEDNKGTKRKKLKTERRVCGRRT